jgi:hypothetical protein
MKIVELIDRPEKWCKNSLAETVNGTGACEDDPDAVRWCVLGAYLKCYGDHLQGYNEIGNAAAERLGLRNGWTGIINFNNAETTTHEDILKVAAIIDDVTATHPKN